MRSNLIRGASRRRPLLRGLIAAAAAFVLSAGVAGIAVNQASAAAGCRVTYTVTNQWDTGFGASLSITNLGDPLTSWTLAWDFGNASQRVSSGWNGTFNQAAGSQHVTVASLSYNGAVGTNQAVTSPPGFNGSYSGSNPVPTSFPERHRVHRRHDEHPANVPDVDRHADRHADHHANRPARRQPVHGR